jgi:hypothetical protein
MRQLFAIAKNTYLQAVRQPVYGIIVLVTLGGMAMAPFLTGFTLDDDDRMLRDIGLSTLLVQGLFLACFVATSVLDNEIEDKTALTVVAKPVSRVIFILGKYLGVLGALFTAHYLAGISFFLAMRHGVLQSAAQSSDVTMILFGPALMLLLALAAAILNYLIEWRFLPTLLSLLVPFMTLAMVVLLFINRDFGIDRHEATQDIEALLPELVPEGVFKGIITFRPDEGNQRFAGHRGKLVRSTWQGPISDEDRDYLLKLSEEIEWKKLVRFLVDASRKSQGREILKASCLVFWAVALLAGFAVAAATRLGLLLTFLINVLAIGLGLVSDQVIRPLAEQPGAWGGLWEAAYRLIPNFQFFWMVDALNEYRLIPLSYVISTSGYAFAYIAALLLLAMALFETREVG